MAKCKAPVRMEICRTYTTYYRTFHWVCGIVRMGIRGDLKLEMLREAIFFP